MPICVVDLDAEVGSYRIDTAPEPHLEWGLQAMRQVGRARAGAGECLLLSGQQPIDLVGERLHFARRRHIEPPSPSGEHIPDRDIAQPALQVCS